MRNGGRVWDPFDIHIEYPPWRTVSFSCFPQVAGRRSAPPVAFAERWCPFLIPWRRFSSCWPGRVPALCAPPPCASAAVLGWWALSRRHRIVSIPSSMRATIRPHSGAPWRWRVFLLYRRCLLSPTTTEAAARQAAFVFATLRGSGARAARRSGEAHRWRWCRSARSSRRRSSGASCASALLFFK